MESLQTRAKQTIILMRSNLHSLNNKERKLAEYILANPLALSGLSIHTLALIWVSVKGPSSIFVRIKAFLAIRSLKKYSLLYHRSSSMNRFSLILALMIAKSVWDNISKVLDDTLTVLDHDAFNLAWRYWLNQNALTFMPGAVPLA